MRNRESLGQRSGVMVNKGRYRRSLFWALAFFGLPVVLFVLMMLDVSDWQKPRWGPVAENEEQLGPAYRTTATVLAIIAAVPYLWLLLRLWERLRITDKSIRRRGVVRNQKLFWEEVIECRDYLNYIHLVPMYKSSAMYIDFYATFAGHKQLSRSIIRKCRDVEANVVVGRHRRRLVVCDMGLVPTLVFLVASAALLLLCRQRITFLGFLTGVVLTFLSAWVWVVTHRNPRRWKSGGYIHLTLLVLALILPPAYFAKEVKMEALAVLTRFETFATLGLFYLFYIAGLLAGSGVISGLLPSRKRRS